MQSQERKRRLAGMRPLGLVMAAVLSLMAASAAQAQGEATISGIVTDATGSAIPHAAVKIINTETGATRSTVADDSGRFEAPLLAVGAYEVTAEQAGFSQAQRTVSLVLGQHTTVDLTLSVAEFHQAVKVEEGALAVQLTTADTSGLVSERQVKDLPLNGRSFDNLLTLNKGIVNFTAQRAGGAGLSASAVGNMFSVSGRRPQENLFLLNGVEYTGASNINTTPGGASGELLGVDAIREFAVVKDTYGAAYGKRAGAQVNIVTTSGTNLFHGSAYEFLRNSALDARNFFDRGSIPQFQRNVFGGSLGGPIKKDKTFLFGNYEGFRQVLDLSNVAFVPDDDARNGFLPCGALSPPPTSCPSSGLVNVGLAAGVAPLLTLWPAANGPELLTSSAAPTGIAINYNNPKQAVREDFGTVRFDQTISGKDSYSVVYTLDDSIAHTPSVNPLSLVDLRARNQVASLSETHVFSTNVLNKATLGFSRAAFFYTGRTPVDIPGFVQGRPIGAVSIGGSTALNSSSQIAGAGTNGNSNLTSNRNLFTESDQVSVTHGIHLITSGVWLQQIQSNDNLAANQYGQAVFTTLQNLLKGTVSTFTVVPSPTPLSFRSLEGAYYAEDTIRLRPTLEVRLGFRGEFTNGWNEKHDRASNWLFDSNGVIETTPIVGRSAFTVNKAKLLPSPRVGLAWSPSSNRTVIRAGFGIYYSLNDSISYRLTQSAPFNTVLGLSKVALSSLNIVPGAVLPSGAKISPAGVQPDLDTPAVASYSLTVAQSLRPDTTLSVGYVGSHGYHGLLSIDANVPIPTICPASPCPANYPLGTMYFPTGAPRANPNLANTTHWFSWGTSHYDALQVEANRHFSHGLQFLASYVLAKSLDEGSSLANAISGSTNAFTMNPLLSHSDYGLSSFDIRHSFAANATYNLPFGQRNGAGVDSLLRRAVSDWQVSTIITAQAGFPFSPQLGFNPTNDGDTRNPIRPSLNPAFMGKVILGRPDRYFDPNAFIVPLNGTYGNAGRDTLKGPGVSEIDISLAKKILVTERFSLQFRGEIFNLLNHANFNTPNPIVFTAATFDPTTGVASATVSPTAGIITSTTTSSRQIQLGLKFLW